jgi:hypothetical protein
MAMTIESTPEQERILLEFLRQPTMSPAERAAAFWSWAESHPPKTPVLSDEAISREMFYTDRG